MTETAATVDFGQIETVLGRLGIPYAAPEAHGILCGLFCAKGYVSYHDWLVVMMDQDDTQIYSQDAEVGAGDLFSSLDNILATTDELEILQEVHTETIRQLNDDGYSFYPLLPDDEQPLSLRTEALVEWCDGFLFGLAAGEVKDFNQLPGDVGEISRDLTDFSRAYHAGSEDQETDEQSYAEIIEYLRIGVVLIYEELQPVRDSHSSSDVLH